MFKSSLKFGRKYSKSKLISGCFACCCSRPMPRGLSLSLSLLVGACFFSIIAWILIDQGPSKEEPNKEFCILFDLGSAGSRAYLLSINQNEKLVSPYPPRNAFVERTKPGLSYHFPSVVNASNTLSRLLQESIKVIRQTEGTLEDTSIHVLGFATAGLRTLAARANESLLDDDEQDQNELIEEDDDMLQTNTITKFLWEIQQQLEGEYPTVHFKRNGFRIISGTEEGIFGWMTLQELVQSGFVLLNSDLSDGKEENILLHSSSPAVLPHDIGVLDFGGASTQITYWVPDLSIEDHNDEDYRRIPPTMEIDHSGILYTHSYLSYGVYEVRYRANDLILSSDTLQHPCLLKGATATHHANHSIVFEGLSDYEGCIDLVKTLFHWDIYCTHPPCSFDGVHMPPLRENQVFIAFDYATVIASHFGYTGTTSLLELEEKVGEYCSLTKEEALADLELHPERMPLTEERLTWRCFEGNYLVTLLKEGYKFTEKEPRLVFTRTLSGENLSWALGAVYSFFFFLPQ